MFDCILRFIYPNAETIQIFFEFTNITQITAYESYDSNYISIKKNTFEHHPHDKIITGNAVHTAKAVVPLHFIQDLTRSQLGDPVVPGKRTF